MDHRSSDGVMRDICDGMCVKNHTLFQKYPNALQVIIYYDDIEICNPLGSKCRKSKARCSYMSIKTFMISEFTGFYVVFSVLS